MDRRQSQTKHSWHRQRNLATRAAYSLCADVHARATRPRACNGINGRGEWDTQLAYQGMPYVATRGTESSSAIESAVSDYRSEEDILSDFMGSIIESDPASSTPHGDIFKAYQKWATEEGIRRQLSSKGLAKRLRERGWIDERTPRVFTLWRGIRLRPENE